MPRLCYALDLHDDAAMIAEYERWHQAENVWPEIVESIVSVGIRDLEIHRVGDRLVLIMDVDEDYDPATKAASDAANPHVRTWEDLMWRFQKPIPGTPAGEKWRAMRRIFSLAETRAEHASVAHAQAES
jgi:L-rhamnose mutarotase